jgi:hypothetical protein
MLMEWEWGQQYHTVSDAACLSLGITCLTSKEETTNPESSKQQGLQKALTLAWIRILFWS